MMTRRVALAAAVGGAAVAAAGVSPVGAAAVPAASTLCPIYRFRNGVWDRCRMFELRVGELFWKDDPDYPAQNRVVSRVAGLPRKNELGKWEVDCTGDSAVAALKTPPLPPAGG